jgi:hypothetical protein
MATKPGEMSGPSAPHVPTVVLMLTQTPACPAAYAAMPLRYSRMRVNSDACAEPLRRRRRRSYTVSTSPGRRSSA